jgi:hypothetical protein
MNDITLVISVSAAEAAKAGVDHFGNTTVGVRPSTLTPAAQDVLSKLLKDSRAIISGTVVYDGGYATELPQVPPIPDSESVAQWLEACAGAVEQKAQQRKQTQAEGEQRDILQTLEWLKYPDDKIIRQGINGEWVAYYPYSFAPSLKAEVQARVADAAKEADRLNAEQAVARAKAKKLKEDAAARRAAQFANWLETRAPDSMRKRAARGLLPEEDLIAAIRNEAYAPLDGLKRFERLTDEDVRAGIDADDDQEVCYATREAKSAHDEDLDMMERIESLRPGATCTLVEHAGWLGDYIGEDGPEVTRYAVRVAVKVGELEFTREYAAGGTH